MIKRKAKFVDWLVALWLLIFLVDGLVEHDCIVLILSICISILWLGSNVLKELYLIADLKAAEISLMKKLEGRISSKLDEIKNRS